MPRGHLNHALTAFQLVFVPELDVNIEELLVFVPELGQNPEESLVFVPELAQILKNH